MESRQSEGLRIGFIGFGEVGFYVGSGLRSEGSVVCAYDKLATDSVRGVQLEERAQEAGVRLVKEPGELSRHADILMCAVPGTNAVEAVDMMLPYLTDRHLYVDMCSASPNIKHIIENRIANKCRLVDAAIMTPPLRLRHRVTVAVSGRHAHVLESLFSPLGMQVDIVGDEIGMAASLKMLRTVFMKGMNALLGEALLAAYRLGIHEQVLDTISHTLETQGFRNMAHLIVTTDAVHAQRRADETRMALELIHEVGLDGKVVKAVIDRLQWSADLGLAERFNHAVPDSYVEVLHATDELEKSRARAPSE